MHCVLPGALRFARSHCSPGPLCVRQVTFCMVTLRFARHCVTHCVLPGTAKLVQVTLWHMMKAQDMDLILCLFVCLFLLLFVCLSIFGSVSQCISADWERNCAFVFTHHPIGSFRSRQGFTSSSCVPPRSLCVFICKNYKVPLQDVWIATFPVPCNYNSCRERRCEYAWFG